LWSRDFVLAFAANFLMAFSFYLLMPTLPLFLSESLSATAASAGIVLSAYVVAAIAVRPFSGFLIDMLPRKRLYLAAFGSFVLLSAAYLRVSSPLSLGILRFVYGLVWGVITTSGNTLAIDIVPSARRGEGIGYYGMSMNLAMAAGPMTGLFLCASGAFSRVFLAAFATALAGLLVATAIRVPARPTRPHAVLSLDRFLLLPALPLGAGLLLVTLSYGVILSYTAVYARQYRIDGGGFFFVALAVGILAARAVSGQLLDRGHACRVAVGGALIAAVGLALLGFLPGTVSFFAAALAAGVGYGMNYPAVQTMIVALADHSQRGTANSTYYIAFDVGVGGGILLAGPIAAHGGLAGAFAASVATTLAGSVLLGLLARRSGRKMPKRD
jgi:MFS family permease